MLTHIEIRLDAKEYISSRASYAFQGILMDLIDNAYAQKLHISGINPYSQYLSYNDKVLQWNINTLNAEAANFIAKPVMDENIKVFMLKKHNTAVDVIDKKISVVNENDLFKFGNLYNDSSNIISLKFITPTAFKQNGRYTFIPDFKCIYNSLINKYNMCCTNSHADCINADIDQLIAVTDLVSYKIESTDFHLKGVNIPGFTGYINIRIKNKDDLGIIALGLLRFSEYSGIGIKSGIGMGAIELTELAHRGR